MGVTLLVVSSVGLSLRLVGLEIALGGVVGLSWLALAGLVLLRLCCGLRQLSFLGAGWLEEHCLLFTPLAGMVLTGS